jgi:hypothetical protein
MNDARLRLPREPYPGLRPFLDFEAALLFGRERQVREVIERLRETQFVAVLGGSGSGKSSLIHAGVTPELRSFGIPGAGDLWLPMVCTPGTNVGAADRAARRHTPITRLARRFGELLTSRGSAEADAQREGEIAAVFRQEDGFARLLDTYGAELAVPPGPDPAEARLLIVLDQFEELFHPTNQDVEDAKLLVERVLDHFFAPHLRCYVVLTMRSEHLNDCAAYLELPDAINKSSYLVRRLDADELRGAIVGPAQRFLRLMARSDPKAALPAEVQFDSAVLDRLLRDVSAINNDPDHLPLLQHMLARLWQAALEREEMDVPVPAHITEIDLVRAVNARATGDEQPLDPELNTLRACVENWPETLYRWHDPEQRVMLDALFRRLAFKDPNTGMYTQQRVDVDAGALLLGPGQTRDALRNLLSEGFLGSVDYLYWDDRDLDRVTLKVSHESFIRGWARFRLLIDEESLRFEEFLAVLRKCGDWIASGRDDDFLLGTGEIRRLGDGDFGARLKRPEQRQDWFRFLGLTRDGAALARLEPELDSFVQQSQQREAERRNHKLRNRRSGLLLAGLTLALLPSALFSIFIQGPVTERAQLLFDAGSRANRAALTPDQPAVGGAADTLESLLRAAALIEAARTGQGGFMSSASQRLLDWLRWIPPVRRQEAFLHGVAAQAEPPVNGKLRQLLSSALWFAEPRGNEAADTSPTELARVSCQPGPGAVAFNSVGGPLSGRLFVSPGAAGGASAAQRRALFLPDSSGSDGDIVLRGASYAPGSGVCQYGQIVQSIPLFLQPHVVVDRSLRYLVYGIEGPNVDQPSATLYEIDWERTPDGRTRVLQSLMRSVVTDAAVVDQVRQAAGPARVAVVPSWRAVGGRALAVADTPWRVVGASAQRVQLEARENQTLHALQVAEPGSPCDQLRAKAGWGEQPGFSSRMYEAVQHCFAITRGNAQVPDHGEPVALLPAAAAPAEAASAALPRETILVAVYERPGPDSLARLDENPPAPIASLAPFARVVAGNEAWFAGSGGEHDGWLLLRGRSANDVYVGAPWSTQALMRLGRELQQRNPPRSRAFAAPSAAAPASR